MTDGQIGAAIEHLLKLAGEGAARRGVDDSVERARHDRELDARVSDG
jgi:hypothetical protein